MTNDRTTDRTGPLRVLVADDNEVVRLGLESLLCAFDDLTLVGAAVNGAEALRIAVELRPDVVLLDVRMPVRDGLSVLPELARCSSVLMLTHSSEGEVVDHAMRAGAVGFLVHGSFSGSELAAAVRDTAAGRARLSPEAVDAILRTARYPGRHADPAAPAAPAAGVPAHSGSPTSPRFPGHHPAGLSAPTMHHEPAQERRATLPPEVVAARGISPREADILELIVRGLDNQAIARTLYIEPKTVKNHINRIFAKLGATSRAGAIAVCLGLNGSPI